MEYERLVELAKEVAGLAAVCRILGQDDAAWSLVQAGDELERSVVQALRAAEDELAPVGEEVLE